MNMFGADDEFNALAFGRKHQNTLNYISQSMNNFTDTFINAGSMFMNRAKELYDRFNSSEALNFARNIRSKYLSINELHNEVVFLNSLSDIQNCSPYMQRWVMANPVIREDWYFKHRLDGYNDTYTNMFGNCSGEKHYDYRRVINGLMTDDRDKIDIYIEEEIEDDPVLSLRDQIKILHSWNLTNMYLSKGKNDPTSKEGNEL